MATTCGVGPACGPPGLRSSALLGLAFILLLPSCRSGPGSAAKMSGYLYVDIESSPLSLDPRFATDAISSRITELMFDSMVRLDSHGGFVGDLAESVERPSPTRLIFHLRRGVRFSDGRPLTTRDVEYTYNWVADPANLSPKRAAMEPFKLIRALDDYTLEIATWRPYAPALESAMLGVVPFGTPGGGGRSAPAGSGPFKLVRFVRDESLVIARNPMRSQSSSAPRGIVFKVVPDPTVRALELAEGVCDFSENNLEPYLLGYLAARPQLKVVSSPGIAYQYIAFNFRDPRLRDLRVRRAIAYAIDREAIVHSMLRDTGRLATGILAPENWAYNGDVARYSCDPAAAKRVLDEAGYRAGPDGMRNLTLVYKCTPEGRRLGEAFQAMLRRVGIELSIRSNEWATFYGDIQRGNFDLTSLQWVGISDPQHYYLVFDSKMAPPNGLNRGWYSNPEMDRLVEGGETTLDPARRREIYARVQKLAADDLPYVSLWWMDNVAVMSRSVLGFTPYPNGSLRSFSTLTLAGAGAREGAELAE
ncbi:MAG: ABC transporter substrate-binding protein [Candidatus Binataceae bacterium]